MSLQDRLPGTYRLVAMETRTTAGQVSRPMGERPMGMFMFDGSNFCVQLAATDRVAFDGDLAIFTTPPTLVDGAEATTMITWRRVSG